jgi:hypothetical protein
MAVPKSTVRLETKPVPTEAVMPAVPPKMVPVAIDFVNTTSIFSLGGLSKVTDAMVEIEEVPKGFRLYSKNRTEEGYYLVGWSGVKGVRYKIERDSSQEA